MNKILSIFCCLCLLSFEPIQAQEEIGERSYDFDNWRVLFQMNGPNNWNGKLNFVTPVHAKWAIRFGINPIFSFNKTVGNNPDLSQYEFFDTETRNRQLGAEIGLGAEFHFIKKGKVDPYLFFGTGIGGFSERNKTTTSYQFLIQPAGQSLEYERKETAKSAPQLTINPFVGIGVNYYFHENLAFGIEYSCSPNMTLIKGTTNTKIEEKNTFEDGTVVESNANIEVNRNAFFVRANPQIGFHLIFVFKNKDE